MKIKRRLSDKLIIPEIGYNHLGSLFLYRSIIILLAKEFNQFTIQYRGDDFPEKIYLDISIEKIIEENKKIRKSFPNLLIGLATESNNIIEKYFDEFDFFKIISDGTKNKEIPPVLIESNKFHVYSVGNNKPSQINSFLDVYYKNNLKPVLNYTSFDPKGNDISSEEINNFFNISSSICLGLHQNNNIHMYSLAAMFDISHVFIYFSTTEKNIVTPDFLHSRTYDEIKIIRSDLESINKIKKQSPRKVFIDYDHTIPSSSTGLN